MSAEVLVFDDLQRYLLLKNGNYLYKVPFRGGYAVLKVYYGSRSRLRYVGGTISNFFEGQSSFMPRARCETERRCLALWRQAGFRVFETYDEVTVRGLPAGGYRLFEFVPGEKLSVFFGDHRRSPAERLTTYRRFLADWHRRHQMAVNRGEPRLVHENGDMKHVMLWQGEFLYFDFEMVYRSAARIRDYIAREILAYLRSLGKAVGPEHFPAYLEATLAHYPGSDLLAHTHRLMFAHPNPVLRLARRLDYRYGARARKPFSKYNIARRLAALLAGRG